MSLRVRLNLLISLLFISLFICASFYIIANARNAVHREVNSTALLALELIQVAFSSNASELDQERQIKLLQRLSQIDETRHLEIELRNPSDVIPAVDQQKLLADINAPGWFVKLVNPPPRELRRWLYNPTIPPTGIIIRADPGDEIEEKWVDVRSMLIFLSVFIILANIMVYVVIGRYLAPIETILSGMSGLEKGNYDFELPRFRLPELDRISERFNHMAKVLAKSKQENKRLTQRSLEIQEQERRHLSQELHDELGQTITAIKAVAVAISNDQQQDKNQVDANVKTIVDYSDHIYKVAKSMMHRLRPSVLDEFGLIKALQNMIDDWNARQDDVFCHFSFSNIQDELEELININIFRIIQESLTNVLKHARASEVKITMHGISHGDQKSIELKIADDGIGLDLDNMESGLGLLGIKERVEMSNGQFEIKSAADKGVTLEILIPLNETGMK